MVKEDCSVLGGADDTWSHCDLHGKHYSSILIYRIKRKQDKQLISDIVPVLSRQEEVTDPLMGLTNGMAAGTIIWSNKRNMFPVYCGHDGYCKQYVYRDFVLRSGFI